MKKSFLLFIIIVIGEGCVERLSIGERGFDKSGVLVVDGVITDGAGPYTVKLFRSSSVEAILNFAEPAFARQITVFDDAGEVEILSNEGDGVYKTSANGIQGKVGRKYHVRVELFDGTIFESDPDEMLPVEEIDTIYSEWQATKPLKGPTEYGFKIFMDTQKGIEGQYLRWRFSGTYMAQSYPQFRRRNGANCSFSPPPPDPPPCSGYIYTGTFFEPGILVRTNECTCCFCWANDYENKPHLNEDILVTDGRYKKIEMGYVPFNQWTFGKGKYMVKVDQMSLSRSSFEFWKIFKDQKEGGTSLFQPSFGKAKSNIRSINSDKEAVGIFYASAVTKKILFITAGMAEIPVPGFDIDPPEDNCVLWKSCSEVFINSSLTPPTEWN